MSDAFDVTVAPEVFHRTWSSASLLGAEGLARDDEQDDAVFYSLTRQRPFYEPTTDAAIRAQHTRLLPGKRRILDLMAGAASHLPNDAREAVVGLGLNEDELRSNPALTSYVIHDLNKRSDLPFDDESFDAVTCSGGIDLLIRPLEVVRNVARVLRKGAPFIVSFTERAIRPKSIRAWRDQDIDGRRTLASAYFSFSNAFLRPHYEVDELETPECVLGGPGATIGDEVLVVMWGYRPPASDVVEPRRDSIEKVPIRSHRYCPYCAKLMALWQPPETPWEIDYGVSILYVCFNDDCAYFQRGIRWCRSNGMRCASYRNSLNPATGTEGPLPVPTRWALRMGIVEES